MKQEEDAGGPSCTLLPVAPAALVDDSGGVFVSGTRVRRDVAWTAAFGGAYALALILGGAAAGNANPQYDVLSSESALAAYGTCHDTPSGRRHLAETDARATARLGSMAANSMVLVFCLSIVGGLLFLNLLRRNAALCVKASCVAQVAIPAILGVSALGAGAVAPGLFGLFAAGLAAFAFYLWRHELALCGRLLSVAAAALNENGHLVSASLGVTLVLCAACVPLLALILAASRVGAPVPLAGALLATGSDASAAATCVDALGAQAPCCIWQTNGAAVAYMVYASLALSWTTFLAFEVRLFAIAHVVTRWYYLPRGGRLAGSPVRDALATAVGPSFGSLCLGSAVLTAAEVVRSAADSARQRGGGLLACLVASVAACVAELVRFLTRFATIRAAATGEAFMDAARSVTDLLARNFLATYAVWRFPPMVLGMTSLVFAAASAVVAGAAYGAAGNAVVVAAGAPGSAARADAGAALAGYTLAVGGGALALVLIILMFISSILLHVVDTVYICWASDLDRAVCSHPEVHAVFAAVPAVRAPGSLVYQPDGELGYAPGTAAQQPVRA